MTSYRLITCLLATVSVLSAADLGSELNNWGPIATGDHDVKDGVWFADAAAIATTRARLDGISFVAREGSPVDGQVTLGRLWDRSELGSDCTYYRFQLRAGTDPLASAAHQGFAAVGGFIHLPAFVSLQWEAGHSQERGTLISGEVAVPFLRVRAEHDDQVDTLRIGTGPRILGTTAPWAWGVLLDWATTHVVLTNQESRTTDRGIAQAFILYRTENHWLFGASLTSTSGAIDRDDPTGRKSSVTETAVTLGATF